MYLIFLLFISACSSDVSVIKRVTEETAETSTEPDTSPSSEPNWPPPPEIEGVGGYVHYYLRQLACPACVGESQELLVEFTAKFHEPVNDSHL